MGRLANVGVSGVLVLGLAAAGCGSSESTQSSSTQAASASQTASSPSSATTPTTTGAEASKSTPSGQAPTSSTPRKHEATANITLSSPAFANEGTISARYTCDGADISLPLRWSAIPHGTAELVLFISAFNGTTPSGGPVISWAVAGLHPTLRGIASGVLPAGAVVGRNSSGQARYSICPPKGSGSQRYIASLFTLPHSVAAKPGFDADALHKTVVGIAEYNGLALFAYQRA